MKWVQSKAANSVLLPPAGMTNEECRPLPVIRFQYVDGTPAVASEWLPSKEELELLNSGATVQLLFIGMTHPPVNIEVTGSETSVTWSELK